MTVDPTSQRSLKEVACAEQAKRPADQLATAAVADWNAHLAEAREQLGLWVQARADAVWAKLVRLATIVALTLAALIAVVSSLVTVVVLLISGLAGGVSELLGDRIWLGNAITSVVLLAVCAFTVRYRWSRYHTAQLRVLEGKYERRRRPRAHVRPNPAAT